MTKESGVANCPHDVLRINDLSETWSFKLEMEETTEQALNEKKSMIYL